ncbi:hypothetical protein XNC1_0802 [Xenorhabdus nematophila ATCC 19061]|uniref:Uncharacterized protein n=1 Tax=Xenorhabdus nematophila (strain ATCC 19061 / DSM 3370 / CCUG 14189 / LMG 1036 / NCIMB 9965 / AN6) TaxID=406817 RepID=D3VKC1_XENNA|nr:hypothetical protein [Xenorhabdus nematophila]CBJ88873.1 hypothetical protein XNC1_0802 [Xenorhabdus nematophila ATCC 19061]
MKSKIILSEPERITLQPLALNHPHRDIRTRRTGLLMLARGIKPSQSTAEIGCSLRVIYNWGCSGQELPDILLASSHCFSYSTGEMPPLKLWGRM